MKGIKFETNGIAHVVDMPVPEPGPAEVVLRVTSTGVCGSDLSALRGKHLFRKPPLISGHEAGGFIHTVGPDVTGFKEGDRVVVDPQKPCGECDLCSSGKYHLCPKKLMLGVAQWDGSFANFVKVPAYTLIPAPESIAEEHLALAEPIAVAAHAVRQLNGRLTDDVLILGGGTIGGLITRVLSADGSRVTVSEPRAFLEEKLKAFGATRVINPGKLESELFDAVFVVADVPSLFEEAFAHLKPGGAIVQVAVFNEEVPIHVGKLQVAEQAILGTAMYQKEDFETALRLLTTYPSIPDILVSRVVGLDEGAEIITQMAAEGPGDILKLVIKP